jgi:hypothetical protein
MISTTDDKQDIIRSFFSVALVCQGHHILEDRTVNSARGSFPVFLLNDYGGLIGNALQDLSVESR